MFRIEVYKTWSLILQLGISVLVPIFLLLFAGIIIKDKFGIDLILVFLIIGVFVGVRNTIVLVKNYVDYLSKNKKNKSELLDKHLKNIKGK